MRSCSFWSLISWGLVELQPQLPGGLAVVLGGVSTVGSNIEFRVTTGGMGFVLFVMSFIALALFLAAAARPG